MTATAIIRDDTYRIRSANANNPNAYLQLQNNDVVVLPLNSTSDAQRWRVVYASDGAYHITCVSGDTPLGIRNPGQVVAGIRSGTNWTIEPRGNSFVIGSAANKTAIHLTERGRVMAFDRNNNSNQRWIFDPNPLRSSSANPTSPPARSTPVYTYTSFTGTVARGDRCWRHCLAVDVPAITSRLQLQSLDFTIKYANTNMTGHSTYQMDIIQTSATLATGTMPYTAALSVYRNIGTNHNYNPFVLDRNIAEPLHTRAGIKEDDVGHTWRHLVIGDSLFFLRDIPPGQRIYVIFNMFEYDTDQTNRYLAMHVTASWSTR